MTTKSLTNSVYGWVDERLGLSELAAFARNKTVPAHAHSFWYYWGGISLFLFIVQCFTGILLLVYYRPGADAYESVRQITFVMHFGWLIRSAHSWSANLMMFAILVHMFSVFFMKAYRRPREFGWLSGMALLALAAVFGFSGYLLPMDELSYFATKVGLQIPAAIPFIGPAIASMLRGGPDVTEFTVQRFFALHVVVLPLVFIPLLGLSPLAGAETRQRRSAQRRSEASKQTQEHFLPARVPAQGPGDVAYLASTSCSAGFGVSVVAGQAVRRAGARADRHSSRVVFHEPLRDAQDPGQLAPRRGRRNRRPAAVHPRHRSLGSDSVL